jgi:hypothetical protein
VVGVLLRVVSVCSNFYLVLLSFIFAFNLSLSVNYCECCKER